MRPVLEVAAASGEGQPVEERLVVGAEPREQRQVVAALEHVDRVELQHAEPLRWRGSAGGCPTAPGAGRPKPCAASAIRRARGGGEGVGHDIATTTEAVPTRRSPPGGDTAGASVGRGDARSRQAREAIRSRSASRRVDRGGVAELGPARMRIAAAWSWRILARRGVVAVVIFLVSSCGSSSSRSWSPCCSRRCCAVLELAAAAPLAEVARRSPSASSAPIAIVAGLVWLIVFTQIRADAATSSTSARQVRRPQGLAARLAAPAHRGADQRLRRRRPVESLQQDSRSLLDRRALASARTARALRSPGVLLALFATLFILIDGRGIWGWIVRLFPRRARAAVDGAGEAGWITLRTSCGCRSSSPRRRGRHRPRRLLPRAVLRRIPAGHPDRDPRLPRLLHPRRRCRA